MRQVAFDIRTSGPEVEYGHRVIEIACVELINKKLTGKHCHRYINPQRTIDELEIEEHGITNEFLEDKPFFGDIIEDLTVFLGEDELIVYNAAKVFGFLKHEILLLGKVKNKNIFSVNNNYIDILDIAISRHPHQDNSLSALCKRYYVDANREYFYSFGALYDAELIAELSISLSNQSSNKIISNIDRYKKGENLFVVDSFSEFDKAVEGIGRSALCRGVSNHEYPLLPSLFRHPKLESIKTRENNLMWIFKTHAKAHLDKLPQSEAEWLTLAQHHGLPTRLLDWSLSPLVACFFAVESLSDFDAAVYVYEAGGFLREENINLEKLDKIHAFLPSHGSRRVSAQSAVFTIHPTEQMQLETESVKKIIIPAGKKKGFLDRLVKFGVHHSSMFPDLDGLSSYIKFLNGYKH